MGSWILPIAAETQQLASGNGLTDRLLRMLARMRLARLRACLRTLNRRGVPC